jgi:hypothetical protein
VALSGQLLGLTGRIMTVLVVLSSCAGISSAAAPALPVADRSAAQEGVVRAPVLVDTEGAALREDHAEVVRAVHRALTAGDLDALRGLYAGDDWVRQAELLARPVVRQSVLDALRTHPANLGEGYLYPGFSAIGWSSPLARSDGALLGWDPAALPDPVTGYPGYRTAFFLDYDPPRSEGGPLRWRGVEPPPGMPV